MRRLLLALLLATVGLPPRPAAAEPFIPGAAFDAPLVADVTATALAFMAPRTLVAIPLARLGLWGLRGLSTLDPRLLPELAGDELRLSLLATPAPRLLLARTLPDAAQPAAAWGDMMASLIRAAWDASQPVRRVGTNGALEVFFDEICNHLDPYSRYATPGEAQADRDLRADAGIDVVARNGGYVIAGVAEAGPAEAAEYGGERECQAEIADRARDHPQLGLVGGALRSVVEVGRRGLGGRVGGHRLVHSSASKPHRNVSRTPICVSHSARNRPSSMKPSRVSSALDGALSGSVSAKTRRCPSSRNSKSSSRVTPSVA